MIDQMLDDRYARMPWDRVDAVVFDLNGVLLALSTQRVMENMLPGDEALYPVLHRKMIQSPYWILYDWGYLTLEETVQKMAGTDTGLIPKIRLFMENWWRFTEPIPEGIETMEICKRHGKRVYVMTNYPDLSFRHHEEDYPFLGMADGVLVSSREKVLKPFPEIYQRFFERFHEIPERTLFIDDSAMNIAAAFAAGWQGLCFNQAGKLHAFFSDDDG